MTRGNLHAIIMDESEFRQLIEKYQEGLLSGHEKALLDEWFDALGKNNTPGGWMIEDKIKLRHKILQQIRKERILSAGAFQRAPLSPEWPWRNIFRAAASFLLLLTISFLVWQFAGGSRPEKEAATPGEVRKIILADGSIVWLKGKSTLTYPEEFTGNDRSVTLLGEALFEVARDVEHPFTIQCGDLVTTVLGTSFNIREKEENIEVIVLTGKVLLTSENDKSGLIVLANEKAVYGVVEKRLTKVDVVIGEDETTAAVVGTEYSMDYEDTRMNEIIRRIEGKFDMKITMQDPKLGNCMITANFTGQSLERTLNMMSQALGFDYEIKDNTVILRGGGCN